MSAHLPLFISLTQSISVPSLAVRPLSGPQLAGVIKQVTPASYASSPTVEQANQLSLG